MIQPTKNDSSDNFHPSRNPDAARSFTSPPPIALQKYIIPAMMLVTNIPIIYSRISGLSVKKIRYPKFTAPKQKMNTLNPNGIIKVRKSITLNASKADAIRQYKMLSTIAVISPNPWTVKINTYSRPFVASTNGYCAEIFAPHLRHFPRRNSQLKSGIKSNHRS